MRNAFLPLFLVACVAAFAAATRFEQVLESARAPSTYVDAGGVEVPQLELVQRQGFPLAGLVEVLSNPAVITALCGLGVAIYNRIARANEKRDRWERIVGTGVAIADELVKHGEKSWPDLAARILGQLVREVAGHPGIDSLTPDEIEQLKPWATDLAKRKTGVIEKPMRFQ